MTLCINLAIRFFSWLTLSLLANRMSTLSTGPPLIKRTPQFPLKLDKNNESFYEPRLSSFVESDMLPKGGGCAPAPGLRGGGGLLLVKQLSAKHHYQPRPHWAPPAPQENIQGFIHKDTHNSLELYHPSTGGNTQHMMSVCSTLIQLQQGDQNIIIAAVSVCTLQSF